MFKVVANSWALFFGLGLIMLGSGLQGSLLGLRASIEGFGLVTTGLVMSGYYIGLLIGATIVPKFVGRVGHIRSFGAMASLASTSILVHLVFVDPLTWWFMRFVTGFAPSSYELFVLISVLISVAVIKTPLSISHIRKSKIF